MRRAGFLATLALLAGALPAFARTETPAPPDAMAEALARVPKATRPLVVHLPRPHRYRLSNGLTLLVLEDRRLPTVTMTMRVRAGSFYEPEGKEGLSRLTAAMLDEGTTTRTAAEIADAADEDGATLITGADQGGPMASVSLTGLSEDAPALVDLLADVVRRPSFPAGALEKVRRQTVADLVQATRDPHALAEAAGLEALYGDTPPARVLPPISQVQGLTREDLVSFHAACYRPERALVGVIGDVDAEAVHRLVERTFGDWRPGRGPGDPHLPAYRPQTRTRVLMVDRPGSVQTVLRLTNLGIDRGSPDYPAVSVMNHILGGTYTSRLWTNIRETRGYAYEVGSDFAALHHTGYWYAGGEVRNAVTAEALGQFFREFQRLQDEPVSPEELKGAQQSLLGHFARQMEDPAALLDNALDVAQYDLPADYWETYPKKVMGVTARDVQRVARKYLGRRRAQVIAVGQSSDIADALRSFGPVQSSDIVRKLQ